MKHLLEILKGWGPWGVFSISLVESMGIPNPGGTDFLLLFIAAVRPYDAFLSAALAIAGSLIGSLLFYEVLRRSGDRFLYERTATGRGKRLRHWFERYGLITVFIPALLPIPILPFKIFAGCAAALGVERKRFFVVLLAARAPRYLALAYLGAKLGEHSGAWLRSHLWHLLAFAALLAILLSVVAHRLSQREEIAQP